MPAPPSDGRERPDDPPRELVLQTEHVAERRLHGLRREERPRRRLDELRGHSELVAGAQERPQQHPIDVGLRGYRPQVRRVGGEAGRGGARSDHQRRQPREGHGDRVGEGEAEEVDLGVRAEQAERQDDDTGQRPRDRRADRTGPGVDGVDLAGHLRGGGGPVGRPLGESAAQDAVERHHRGVSGQRRWLLVQRGTQHLDDRRSQKGGPPGHGLVQDRGRRKQVGARVDLGSPDLLRRHVARRPDDEARPREVGPGLDGAGQLLRERPGEAEVEDLHAVGRDEHVRGLEVAMHDAGGMERLERREDPAREGHRLVDRERAAGEPRRERFSREQLHRDVEPP